MRWTIVVMTLGFFGLVAYYLNLSYRKHRLQSNKRNEETHGK